MLAAGMIGVAGLAMLTLAMPRHWRELKTKPPTRFQPLILRITGTVLLIFSFWLLTGQDNEITGLVTGSGLIMLAGISWSLLFSLWPRGTTMTVLILGSVALSVCIV